MEYTYLYKSLSTLRGDGNLYSFPLIVLYLDPRYKNLSASRGDGNTLALQFLVQQV